MVREIEQTLYYCHKIGSRIFAIEWLHCECYTSWTWPTFSRVQNLKCYYLENGKNYWKILNYDLLSSYDLTQFVTQPTHNPGRLLDVVITSNSNAPQGRSVTDVSLSDHLLLSWTINTAPPEPTYITISRRCCKNFDFESFKDDLLKSKLCSRSPAQDEIKPLSIGAMVSQYNTVITNLLDKHAPVVEITVRHRKW